MSMDSLLRQIASDERCALLKPAGSPAIPTGMRLPADLARFYSRAGGAVLFRDQEYPITVSRPREFVKSNEAILGTTVPGDISDKWFVVAHWLESRQYISMDLAEERHGRCYDSFWETHGLRGDSPVVAPCFSELLRRLYDGRGQRWFWLREDFVRLGDAYDGIDE